MVREVLLDDWRITVRKWNLKFVVDLYLSTGSEACPRGILIVYIFVVVVDLNAN